jgi:hypothetical protein
MVSDSILAAQILKVKTLKNKRIIREMRKIPANIIAVI